MEHNEGNAIRRYKEYQLKHLPAGETLESLWMQGFDKDAYPELDTIDALKAYLNQAEKYVKVLTTAARYRQEHFEQFIECNPERIEDDGHKVWREGMNKLADDANKTLQEWKSVHSDMLDEYIANQENHKPPVFLSTRNVDYVSKKQVSEKIVSRPNTSVKQRNYAKKQKNLQKKQSKAQKDKTDHEILDCKIKDMNEKSDIVNKKHGVNIKIEYLISVLDLYTDMRDDAMLDNILEKFIECHDNLNKASILKDYSWENIFALFQKIFQVTHKLPNLGQTSSDKDFHMVDIIMNTMLYMLRFIFVDDIQTDLQAFFSCFITYYISLLDPSTMLISNHNHFDDILSVALYKLGIYYGNDYSKIFGFIQELFARGVDINLVAPHQEQWFLHYIYALFHESYYIANTRQLLLLKNCDSTYIRAVFNNNKIDWLSPPAFDHLKYKAIGRLIKWPFCFRYPSKERVETYKSLLATIKKKL